MPLKAGSWFIIFVTLLKLSLMTSVSKLKLLLFVTLYLQATAKNLPGNQPLKVAAQLLSFTENKGQICDQNSKPRPDILFSGSADGMDYHLRKNGISYQLNKISSWKAVENSRVSKDLKVPDQTSIYRLDINWLNCNQNIQIEKDQELEGLMNYYLEVCPDGVHEVKSYAGVTFENIYNGINLHYYEKAGLLKYDYMVAPHTDYKQIRLQINGATKISLQRDGSVIISTPLGKIREGQPVVFQNGKQLSAKWILKNNELSFEVENYDPGFELIIDPAVRTWGTYYGGSGYLFGMAVVTDASNNVIIGGMAYSTAGVATSGAYQATIGGSSDAYVAKFNASGVRIWGTYYGGSGTEWGFGACTDVNGNIFLTGYTTSTVTGVIATPGAFQMSNGGSYDAFLVKFNGLGVRQWGTFYGHQYADQGNSCSADFNGNVYLTGYISSNTSTPTGTLIASTGSHQDTYGGGNYDAFLVKFSSTGVRKWATFYGGNAVDQGNSCSADALGNIYLAGYTSSNTGTAIATSSAFQTSQGGSNDAFLAKFDSTGIRQWGTFCGGVADERALSCSTDNGNNVYVAGTNLYGGTVMATPGAHQPAAAGDLDAFLEKFDASGTRQWGTYYGSYMDEQFISCSADIFGNVYLGGSSASPGGSVIATPGSHQTVNNLGANDGFLVRFTGNGVRQWGTLYGGTGNESAYSCWPDLLGNVYLTGITGSSVGAGTLIATSGSHLSSVNGNAGFLVQFFTCSDVTTTLVAQNNVLCNGGSSGSATIAASGGTGLTYSWSPSGGNSAIAASLTSQTYTCKVTNSCGATAIQTVFISSAADLSLTISANTSSVCMAASTLIANGAGGTGALTYSWTAGPAGTVYVVNPAAYSVFTLSLTDANNCVKMQTVGVASNTVPVISVNSGAICSGKSFTIIPAGAATYTFSSGSAIVSPGVTTSYSISGANSFGCVSSAPAISTVTVHPLPVLSVNSGSICKGGSFTITPSGASSYFYYPGGPVTSPGQSSTFTIVGVNAITSCSNSVISTVTVLPLPLVTATAEPDTICAGESATLIADGALTYSWSSGTSGPTTVVSPPVTGTFSVTGFDQAGCSKKTSLFLFVDECAGIGEKTAGSGGYLVYPNPHQDQIFVRSNGPAVFEIHHVSGGLLTWGNLDKGDNSLDLRSFAAGVYLLTIKNDRGTINYKLIRE
jgi:hypothetical protein